MPLDIRRFQFLLGTPCECQTITYTDSEGAHISEVRCCARCWEIGMMQLAADTSQQSREVEDRQLGFEMDGVFVRPTPRSP